MSDSHAMPCLTCGQQKYRIMACEVKCGGAYNFYEPIGPTLPATTSNLGWSVPDQPTFESYRNWTENQNTGYEFLYLMMATVPKHGKIRQDNHIHSSIILTQIRSITHR